MTATRDLLRTYICYTEWANDAMLAACAGFSASELERDLGASHSSLLYTLRHMYLAERVWLERLVSGKLPALVDMAAPEVVSGTAIDSSLADLREDWPAIPRDLRNWLDAAPDEDLDAELTCLMPDGGRLDTSRAELLLHNLNHSTIHRGQVIGMIRALGAQPPNLDVFSYFLYRRPAG
ncbi:MAG TPA: DinB family protein [Terracidiphilus sp.]|nr:DinB family protein [Terracidiphilus sp.]